MGKKTLLIREVGERNLYEGYDYLLQHPVARDSKMEYKGLLYIVISIIEEGSNRTILVKELNDAKA